MKLIALNERTLPAHCFIFKHSTACPISAHALQEVESAETEIPIYRVDVREQRELSNWIASVYSVEHESPQLILIREGKAAKVLNHGAIRRGEIRE
jgi:bacillithiol system protein YtxJ